MLSRLMLAAALVAAALATAPAQAGRCTARDSWRGPDKTLHLVAGAAVAAAGTSQTRDPWAGLAAGLAVGVAKELGDIRGGQCSLQDLAATALGAALGAAAVGLALSHDQGTTRLTFSTRF